MSGKLVAQAATYTTHNKHNRRTSMPSTEFGPAIPKLRTAAEQCLRPHGYRHPCYILTAFVKCMPNCSAYIMKAFELILLELARTQDLLPNYDKNKLEYSWGCSARTLLSPNQLYKTKVTIIHSIISSLLCMGVNRGVSLWGMIWCGCKMRCFTSRKDFVWV